MYMQIVYANDAGIDLISNDGAFRLHEGQREQANLFHTSLFSHCIRHNYYILHYYYTWHTYKWSAYLQIHQSKRHICNELSRSTLQTTCHVFLLKKTVSLEFWANIICEGRYNRFQHGEKQVAVNLTVFFYILQQSETAVFLIVGLFAAWFANQGSPILPTEFSPTRAVSFFPFVLTDGAI